MSSKKISVSISTPDAQAMALRIKDLRRKLGFNQKDLAKSCGVTQASISIWEKAKSVPSASILMQLGRLAGDQDKNWWFERAGAKLQDLANGDSDSPAVRNIALLRDAAAAGTPRAMDENEIDKWFAMPKDLLPRGGTFTAIRVKGDSMAPIILDGYIVFIDTNERDPKNLVGAMIAAREDDGVTIKWLRKDEGHFLLVPQHTSPRHQVRVINKSGNWGIVGKVVRWIGEPPKR